ncbi:MAG: hypothetical protein ACRDK0_06095 [Solirubrobacteraceae bacterium]
MSDDGLRVAASVAGDARWPTTARVDVRVRNEGPQPVKVARRLAVGYRETDGRELFAEVYPRGSDEVVSRMTKLYDRDPAAAEEYVALAPGEELDTTFDLLRWYGLPGPGSYDLEVFYEGDGLLAPEVEGAARGVHGSGRVPFELPEETWG